MLKPIIKYQFFIFFALLTGVSFTNKAYAEFELLSERERTLVIGKITSNPKKHYPALKPMVNYAAAHMKDLGINKTRVLLAKDMEQMLLYLREGSIDWITDTPLVASVMENDGNAELLLLKWKKGVPKYHTVIFVRKDSNIDKLSDLKGKTITFQDKSSTSAYLIPISMLLDQDLQLLELGSVKSVPPPDKVGYLFTLNEVTMSVWVHKKIVDAGAFSNLDWEAGNKVADSFKDAFKVLSHSRSFPRALELVRKKLNPAIKHRLKNILLNAHNAPDADAATALKAYQKTSRFDEIDNKIRADIEEINRMRQRVNNALN